MLTLPLAAAFAASVLFTSFLSGIFGMAGGMILMGLFRYAPLAQTPPQGRGQKQPQQRGSAVQLLLRSNVLLKLWAFLS